MDPEQNKVQDIPQPQDEPTNVDAPKQTDQQQKVNDINAQEDQKKETVLQNKQEKKEEKKEEQKKEEEKKNQKKEQKKEQNKQQKKVEKKQQKMEQKPVEKKNEQGQKLMKVAIVTGPSTLQVKEVPIPKPASGEVLVKVMAAPINPSDMALYLGHYSRQKKFPTAMGFEGCGIVVENGGGMMGWTFKDKKVAFAVQKQGQGSYSQYVICKAEECFPLADDTPFDQGAMSIINPFTALGMLDLLNQRKQKCVVFTAAASALGRMVNRLYPQSGVQVINVVRRAEQVEILKKQGAEHIINTESPDWEKQLTELAEKMGAKTCLECVGGDFTGTIMKCMPKGSLTTVYGCLSQKPVGNIDVGDMLFSAKKMDTFMLVQWLKSKNIITLLPTFYKVRKTISQTLKSEVAKKFSLDKIQQAIKFYVQNMTKGKVIIEPWSDI